MYYLELIERFWDFNRYARVGPTLTSVYMYLLKLAKDNDGYNVTVSDVTVADTIGITRKSVKSTKEKLRDLGLVEFDTRSGIPCKYRILLSYSAQSGNLDKAEDHSSDQIQETNVEGQTNQLLTVDLREPGHVKTERYVEESTSNEFRRERDISFKEFMDFARTLEDYEPGLDSRLLEKYRLWRKNGWQNNSGRPISNWRSSLKSILPFIKSGNIDPTQDPDSIPTVQIPL